jgi:hypothetical protein
MRGFVVTMLWILGVLSILGGVGGLLVMRPWASGAWPTAIGFLAGGLFGSAIPLALAYIAESVFAMEERSQMNEIKAQRSQLGS